MKTMELLVSLDNVKDAYVIGAEDFRQGRQGKRLSVKRVWLIAAAVALMLLLVGCAVVYMLRMQDLTVGEWKDDVPVVFDENGDRIPIETREPTILLSLQNTNMEALSEWLAFTDSYDPDGSIMTEADKALKSGNRWDIPWNYYITYGCYSKEMAAKLDEIVEKYDLKLLSAYETFMYYQSQAMLDCLGVESLVYDDTGVEYWGGYLHPEGMFDMDMALNLDMGEWSLKENWASYRYSVKDYFDAQTGGMKESQTYTQWDYTRKDGMTVLLILNENTARIYADLPEAFISVHVDPMMMVDGGEMPMTQEALEQMAEFFDLSIRPQPTTLENVQKYLEDSQAAFEAEKDAADAREEEKLQNTMTQGYEALVDYHLENSMEPERASYLLRDINGDGVEELIISGSMIYSLRDGEAYEYFNITESGSLGCRFRPCEGNVFEVYSEYDFVTNHEYLFYRANADGAEFITGVTYNTNQDIWYRNLTDGWESEKAQITAEEAQKILGEFTRVDFDWLPLIKYGQPVRSTECTDPYAKYIADRLDRFEEAVDYTYTLMDLNGDGQEELITRDCIVEQGGGRYIELNIHTIMDGKRVQLDILGVAYICEGGILESSDDYVESEDRHNYHAYYRLNGNDVEQIESIRLEPFSNYWTHSEGDDDRQPISEEKAMSILSSYKRIELDMKPFTEYPFQ